MKFSPVSLPTAGLLFLGGKSNYEFNQANLEESLQQKMDFSSFQ